MGQNSFPLFFFSLRRIPLYLGCSLLSCSILLRYVHCFRLATLFLPVILSLIPAAFAMKYWRVFICFARWLVWFCRPFPLPSIHDFCFDLEQNKRKSIMRPRLVASSNLKLFVFWVVHLVLLNIIASYYKHFRGALFFSMFFFLFPAVFALESCPVPFCFVRGPSVIAVRFYCLRSTTSLVSTLSKRKENQSSVRGRSLPGIVLQISSFVSRPDRTNLHSMFVQQHGVSQGTSKRYFFFFGLSPPLFRSQSPTT